MNNSKKIFKQYYHDSYKIFVLCFDKIQNGARDEKTINSFRTSIKRLRILYKTINRCNKSNITTDISELKMIFKSVAKLRDFQVALKIAQQNSAHYLFIDFIQYLEEIIENEKLSTQKAFQNFSLSPIVSEFQILLNQDFFEPLEKIYAQKKRELVKSLTEFQDADQFHKIRIRLKEIIYLEEMISGKHSVKTPEIIFAARMGRRHDCVVFAEILQNFIKALNPQNKTALSEKLAEIQKRNKREMKKIFSKLKFFFQSSQEKL